MQISNHANLKSSEIRAVILFDSLKASTHDNVTMQYRALLTRYFPLLSSHEREECHQ